MKCSHMHLGHTVRQERRLSPWFMEWKQFYPVEIPSLRVLMESKVEEGDLDNLGYLS